MRSAIKFLLVFLATALLAVSFTPPASAVSEEAAAAASSKVASLIRADSLRRHLPYGWYAQAVDPCWQLTLYRPNQRVPYSQAPASACAGGAKGTHMSFGSKAGTNVMPFWKRLPSSVRAVHINGSGYLQVNVGDMICYGTHFAEKEIGTPLIDSWTCETFKEFLMSHPQDMVFFQNIDWGSVR